MAVYTVHQPPLKRYETAPDPMRFVFVRDGFSFWAFLFGPLWMLRHRMWLILLGYIVLVLAMAVGLRVASASGAIWFTAILLLAILIGIEAGTLRRYALGRRRFQPIGVVVGDGWEAAERRFFDSWTQGSWTQGSWTQGSWTHGKVLTRSPMQPDLAAAGAPASRNPAASPEIIGLFPQSGSRR